MIFMEDVSVSFQASRKRQDVLVDVCCSFERNGGIIGILGEKKSGKTTLLNVLEGSLRPQTGRVICDGSVSWVLSSHRVLIPTMTVRGNIRFVGMLYGASVAGLIRDVREMAELHDVMDVKIKALPRDRQSRLVYCLGLCLRFDYYLADETLLIGDHAFRKKMADYLSATASERTVILVSKSPAAVRTHCERAHVLRDGHLHSYNQVGQAIKAFNAFR